MKKHYPSFNNLRNIPTFSQKVAQDLAIPNAVSLVICYNYLLLWDKLDPKNYEGDLSEMLGEPLEFYGEFELSEEVPMRGYLSGYQMGKYTGYARNEEEFLDQLEDGEYYNYDVDHNDYIEYHAADIDWEVDEGYLDDHVAQRVGDLRDDLIDNVELVNK